MMVLGFMDSFILTSHCPLAASSGARTRAQHAAARWCALAPHAAARAPVRGVIGVAGAVPRSSATPLRPSPLLQLPFFSPSARACAWGAHVRRAGTSGRARPLRQAQAAPSCTRGRASRCSRRGNAGGLARRADGGGRAQKAAPPRHAREWAAPRARAAPPRASGRRRRTPGNVAPRVRCRRRLVGRAPRPHVPRTQSVEGLPAATARGPV